MSSKATEIDIEFEFVQPIHVEDLEIPLQEPFTEAEPCSKRKPVSNFIVTSINIYLFLNVRGHSA